jgi:hypothetical protein
MHVLRQNTRHCQKAVTLFSAVLFVMTLTRVVWLTQDTVKGMAKLWSNGRGIQTIQTMLVQTGAEETNVFSYKNNFVYFQHKKVLITQKRRYFNALLKYVPNYVRKIMSVR